MHLKSDYAQLQIASVCTYIQHIAQEPFVERDSISKVQEVKIKVLSNPFSTR